MRYGDVLLLIYMCVIERGFVNIKYAEALGCPDRHSYYSTPDMVLAGRVKYVVKQTLLSEIPKCSKYSSDF